MAHCAQSPSFILHQVTCQFATGETLFGPLNVSLENSLCGLVGRNGVGKTRLLRLLAGIDTPSGGHIERPVSLVCVAQQHTITPQTTLAALLGYGPHFAALQRLGRGEALADDVDSLEGFWDLPDRLSAGFRQAGLADFDPDRPASSLIRPIKKTQRLWRVLLLPVTKMMKMRLLCMSPTGSLGEAPGYPTA